MIFQCSCVRLEVDEALNWLRGTNGIGELPYRVFRGTTNVWGIAGFVLFFFAYVLFLGALEGIGLFNMTNISGSFVIRC